MSEAGYSKLHDGVVPRQQTFSERAEQAEMGCVKMTAGMINPRLLQFQKRAPQMTCCVVLVIIAGMAGVTTFERVEGTQSVTALMSLGGSEDIGSNQDSNTGVCETNVTFQNVAKELIEIPELEPLTMYLALPCNASVSHCSSCADQGGTVCAACDKGYSLTHTGCQASKDTTAAEFEGVYEVENVHSGLALTVTSYSLAPGAQVVQFSNAAVPTAAQWRLIKVSDTSWPNTEAKFAVKDVTAAFPFSPLTQARARFASIWAPMLPYWNVTSITDCDAQCDYFVPEEDITHGSTNESCALLAEARQAAAFRFANRTCVILDESCETKKCVHWNETWRTHTGLPLSSRFSRWIREPAPKIAMYSDQVKAYAKIFEPMMDYGPSIGLVKPDVIFITTDTVSGLQILSFTSEMQNFTRNFYNFVQRRQDQAEFFVFPCRIPSVNCTDYQCFSTSAPKCAPSVACSVGGGIVSVKSVRRKSWRESIVVALALTHNLELIATGLVVFFFVFACMTKKEREEMHVAKVSELSTIIQAKKVERGNQDPVSSASEEGLQEVWERIRRLEDANMMGRNPR